MPGISGGGGSGSKTTTSSSGQIVCRCRNTSPSLPSSKKTAWRASKLLWNHRVESCCQYLVRTHPFHHWVKSKHLVTDLNYQHYFYSSSSSSLSRITMSSASSKNRLARSANSSLVISSRGYSGTMGILTNFSLGMFYPLSVLSSLHPQYRTPPCLSGGRGSGSNTTTLSSGHIFCK